METELKNKVADLLIEIERIKKTSGQRFKQNKELKRKEKSLEILESRFRVLNEFLIKNNLPIRTYEGRERIDFSVMNAIRGLIVQNKIDKKVNCDGVYSVYINKEWKIAKIAHRLCWQIKIDSAEEWTALHTVEVKDFVFIDFLDREPK